MQSREASEEASSEEQEGEGEGRATAARETARPPRLRTSKSSTGEAEPQAASASALAHAIAEIDAAGLAGTRTRAEEKELDEEGEESRGVRTTAPSAPAVATAAEEGGSPPPPPPPQEGTATEVIAPECSLSLQGTRSATSKSSSFSFVSAIVAPGLLGKETRRRQRDPSAHPAASNVVVVAAEGLEI